MVPDDAGGGVMRVEVLREEVDGLAELLAVVDGFDGALTEGLLRPGPEQGEALAGLARAVAGSPLGARVAEAAREAAAGTAGEEHLVVLAAARAALLGSAHDALAGLVAEATGRRTEPFEPGPAEGDAPATGPGGSGSNVSAAARSWLAELARVGWRGLGHEVVAGAAPVVSALLPDPAARRAAVLLDGFAGELAACCPGASIEEVPERRWADLWSRGLLLTVPGVLGGSAVAVGTVSGRLLPLGVDLREHPTAVSAQVHAVLEPADGGPGRLVRASVSAPKPDTVVGAGLWQVLRPHATLPAAVAEGRSVELVEMPVTAEGELLWDEARARPGEPVDAFTAARMALASATDTALAPHERHPARLAVPVLLEGYTVHTGDGDRDGDGDGDGDVTEFAFAGGGRLLVDTDLVPQAGPLTPEVVAASTACLGLLRWDAGVFTVQPLAVERLVRKRPVVVHAAGWAGGPGTDKAAAKAEKTAADAMGVLRERAGRLLRA
ncbi:hypothetical protein ACN20G_31005 (plasmid) [Streptomyces sp. BI20]|uniref:hypothetical protein n=1 Tax=Streptomyces sp. BI20 TaxID=3403460 RepID=UPI003C731427